VLPLLLLQLAPVPAVLLGALAPPAAALGNPAEQDEAIRLKQPYTDPFKGGLYFTFAHDACNWPY
jgi:hypothetical protein